MATETVLNYARLSFGAWPLASLEAWPGPVPSAPLSEAERAGALRPTPAPFGRLPASEPARLRGLSLGVSVTAGLGGAVGSPICLRHARSPSLKRESKRLQ